MKPEIENAVKEMARSILAECGGNPGPGFPGEVYGRLQQERPEVVAYIKRHKKGDPYQHIAGICNQIRRT